MVTLDVYMSHTHEVQCPPCSIKKHKCSHMQVAPDSITECRVWELIMVLGNQPAGDTHTHTRLTALCLGLPR